MYLRLLVSFFLVSSFSSFLLQIKISDFQVSDDYFTNSSILVESKMKHRDLFSFMSNLLLLDGPSVQDRILGSFNSDINQNPSHDIYSTSNFVTIHYALRFDLSLKPDDFYGSYVKSHWKLEWSTHESTVFPRS